MSRKQASLPPTYDPTRHAKPAPFMDGEGVRGDGRAFHQCRPAFMRTEAVTAASGSAYAEFGNTKVIVSVFGPRESKKAMMYSEVGRINCNVSFTTFSSRHRDQETDNKEFSSVLHKALEGAIILESFPKTTVDVFALVLESGGSDLPVIISCASLAVADAGILMYDLVSAVSVSCRGKSFVIDPILEEEKSQDGSLIITCMPSRNEVTQLILTGEWAAPKIHEIGQQRQCLKLRIVPLLKEFRSRENREAMELCLDACGKLGNVMRSCLKEAASGSS